MLGNPFALAVDGSGNVYLVGPVTHNAFKITPGGVITEIIDATGDGGGNTLDAPRGIAVDDSGNVYVAAKTSDNAFKITPGGVVTEIIDATGDGAGNSLDAPFGIALDGSGNVYVTGNVSHNAFKIAAPGTCSTGGTPCVITEIIDLSGDSAGNTLDAPACIVVDASGNVYLTGTGSDNAFKITPGGAINEIIDSTGDGAGNTLATARSITVDGAGNVYVTGDLGGNAFKITPGGVITEIIDDTGDGAGNPLALPRGIAVDGSGNVYVTGWSSDNAFKITPGGVITEIIDATGDGAGNALNAPAGVGVDPSGNVYMTGQVSDNAFKIRQRVFVDADALGANDGTSWTDAYTSLQDGIADADGVVITEVWVAAGTYTPDARSCDFDLDCVGAGGDTCELGECVWSTPRAQTFQLANGVAIYGGFAGGETLLSQRDPAVNVTILSGDIGQNDTLLACLNNSPDCDSNGGLCVDGFCITNDNMSDNSYNIVTGTLTDATAVLDGFTISAGNADDPMVGMPQSRGPAIIANIGSPTIVNCTITGNTSTSRGGIYFASATGESPTVTNCLFRGNTTLGSGGAMGILTSNPTLTGCTFIQNTAGFGGGAIFNDVGNPIMTNCVFDRNSAIGGQAGAFSNINSFGNPTGSDAVFRDCIFVRNSASSFGGAVDNRGSSIVTLIDCLFEDNTSGSGAGLYNTVNSLSTVVNCSFLGNTAVNRGGGMLNNGGSPSVVVNCLFSGNTAGEFGGAFLNKISDSVITNCTFIGNVADEFGGGIYNFDNGSITVRNGIFWGNIDDADSSIGGPFIDESAQIHIDSGTPIVNHSVVQGGWSGAGGVGIVSSDPLFVDADGPDNVAGTADDNMRLSPCSPAIDAGDNDALPLDVADVDGDGDTAELLPLDGFDRPRRLDDPNTIDSGNAGTPGIPVVDIGAFEFAPQLYVDVDAGGLNVGSTWADAYTTLQGALADARVVSGAVTEMWVAEGTYNPDDGGGQTPGDRSATFQLRSGLGIYGRFVGTETCRDQRDITANETILSGDLSGDDVFVACANSLPDCGANGGLCVRGFCIISNNNAENSFHVTTGSGTDATAILDGFTIKLGNADGAGANERGAGMINDSGSPTVSNCSFSGNSAVAGGGMDNMESSSPTVTNCTFNGNRAIGAGGGMVNISNSDSTLTNCSFSGNAAANGGGMSNFSNSNPRVTNCAFSDNAANFGGGMRNSNSNPTVTNCTFSGNTVQQGGGMFSDSSNPTVTNCSFSGNAANMSGGGMYNEFGSPTVSDCTFSANSANGNGGTVGGGGIFNTGVLSNPGFSNCILWNNSDGGGMDESAQIHTDSGTPVVNFSLVQGGWTGAGGVGIVSTDPLFVDANGPDLIFGTADDDLRLLPGSPGIDAGDNDALPLDGGDLDGDGDTSEALPLDLGGLARRIDYAVVVDANFGGDRGPPVVDMGAHEFFPDCNGNGIHDTTDIAGVTSDDCDGNFIPDECDQADCVDDPFCGDCDVNLILDGCDIADCAGDPACEDCNNDGMGNGIPDGCETDCNGNGVPDDCDITNLVSPDCNFNGLPDECEIAVASPAPGGPFFCSVNCDPDCDDNGVPDACDIASCDAMLDPGCDDCNNNGVLDVCDIAGLTSDDGNGDFIPDECIAWTGADIADDNWSSPGNWDGGVIPNNQGSPTAGPPMNAEFSVVIEGAGSDVLLDNGGPPPGGGADLPDVEIDTLVLDTGATLSMTADPLGAEGDLTLADAGGIAVQVDATLNVGPGRTIDDLAAAMGANLTISDGGTVNVDDSMISLQGEVVVGAAGLYQANPAAPVGQSAALSAGSAVIQESSPNDLLHVPGEMNLNSSMLVTVSGSFTLEGLNAVGTSCTPPILRLSQNARLEIGGDLVVLGSATIDQNSSQAIAVAGDFINQAVDSTGINFGGGGIVLGGPAPIAGTGAPQFFEVSSIDLGATNAGMAGGIVLSSLSIAAGANVVFVNQFDNNPDLADTGGEALYVNQLDCQAGGTINLAGVSLYYQSLVPGPGCASITLGGDAAMMQVCDPGPCVDPPINDACGAAIMVTGQSTPFDATAATMDGPIDCPENPGAGTKDVWFRFVAARDGLLTTSLCDGTDYDTTLHVYENTGCGASLGPLLGCDNDGCGLLAGPSLVTIPVVGGQSLLIRVGGVNGAAGRGEVRFEVNQPAIVAPAKPLAENFFGVVCGAVGDPGCTNTSFCVPDENGNFPGTCYVPKNRYLSIDSNPSNAGTLTARRVSIPAPLGGTTVVGWVGPPTLVTPLDEAPILFANVQTTSHYTDWGALGGTVHVGDCEIRSGDGIVGQSYLIESIVEGADEVDPASYSTPLVLRTSIKYGDTIGPLALPGQSSPPENAANFQDIFAAVAAFQQTNQTASVIWVDLTPEVPDAFANFADIFGAVTGFQTAGAGYPFTADPCQCSGGCP